MATPEIKPGTSGLGMQGLPSGPLSTVSHIRVHSRLRLSCPRDAPAAGSTGSLPVRLCLRPAGGSAAPSEMAPSLHSGPGCGEQSRRGPRPSGEEPMTPRPRWRMGWRVSLCTGSRRITRGESGVAGNWDPEARGSGWRGLALLLTPHLCPAHCGRLSSLP